MEEGEEEESECTGEAIGEGEEEAHDEEAEEAEDENINDVGEMPPPPPPPAMPNAKGDHGGAMGMENSSTSIVCVRGYSWRYTKGNVFFFSAFSFCFP